MNGYFQVVLHEPEIPNNTGNIGRTCIAMGCGLHLIKPLGFDTDEKALRRAGLDYWPRLNPTEHESWDEYEQASPGARRWLFSTRPGRPVYEADFRPGDHLVFGKETKGLPQNLLDAHPDQVLTFPMVRGERSLNVATAVCAALVEATTALVRSGHIRVSDDARFDPPSGPADSG